jgi:hypothetical protein
LRKTFLVFTELCFHIIANKVFFIFFWRICKKPEIPAESQIPAESHVVDSALQQEIFIYFHLMSVKLKIAEPDGIYFITITCFKWLPLFDIAESYDSVYKWFQYLKLNNHFITGYVIMPNHLHVLIAFSNTGKKH